MEIDWGIADKIYARAEEKILAETTKEEQKIAQDCTKRRVDGTTIWLSAMHKACMDMLAQLAEARIDADWEIVSQSKENITDLEIARIISRLSDVLTRHISSLMQSITISANRNRIGGSALFSSFEFKNNRTKAGLLAKAKRELDIRRSLLERRVEGDTSLSKEVTIKADQVYIGDKGTQIQRKTVVEGKTLKQFFSELRQSIQQSELSTEIKACLIEDVNALESSDLSQVTVACKTENIIKQVPALKEKLESFVLGVGSSLVATEVWTHGDKIVAGIKFALGLS